MDQRDARVWPVATVVVLGAIGSIFATTSVNVALGTLTRALDTDMRAVQWVATGYLLGLAIAIPTSGWLSRRFGASRLYLITLAAFATTSLLCATATSIEMLIAFRVLQGIAGGATLPVGMMMLATVAGPDRMGRVMSIVGVPMILGPIVGPTLAGALVEFLSWRSIFLMNVPLSLTSLLLGRRLLPPLPAVPAGPFDKRGFALMAIGTPSLVYGLARAGQTGSGLELFGLAMIVLGTVLICAFVLHAWRTDFPLLDVRLWANPGFAACALTALLVSGALLGSMFLLPLFFQTVRGTSPMATGLLLMPQGIGAAISIAICGRLTDRIGGGRVALVGITVLAATTVPFAFVHAATPAWVIWAVLFVRGLGMGGSVMPAMAAAYLQLRREHIPDATPQLNVLQRLGGAFGTTVLTLALSAGPAGFVGGATDLPAAQVAHAFNMTFAWAAGMCLLALAPALALAFIDRRARPPDDLDRLRRLEPDLEVATA